MNKSIIVIFLILVLGCNISAESKIKQKAIGTELSFIGIDFEKNTKIVEEKDIVDIQLADCGWVNYALINDTCYRASIGLDKENVLWYIFYDKNSLEQVKIEQLFKT